MEKLGKFITRHKILIIVTFILLIIPSFMGMIKTETNYDLLTYLPDEFNSRQGQEILDKDFGIGIGINTGYMTVGNIGSDNHMDYTVRGNQVNVASRLESRAGPGQILISQRTYSRVHDFVIVDGMGSISIKGIHDPVETFNVKIK